MSKYPDCFPENFETEILPQDARKEDRNVYRIIKSGKIDRNSFISTYEEIKRGLRPPTKSIKQNDPSLYSTSCNMRYTDAQYALKMFMRHYPTPFIAKGVTDMECGPSQITSDREPKEKSSHVDWWIYDKATPEVHFKKIK